MTGAIILAAGTSSRLRPLTDDRPKSLLEIHGRPILLWQLDLLSTAGITDVTIITGYLGDMIESRVGGRARFVRYEDFRKTNNLGTLAACAQVLEGDRLVLFADVLFEPALLARCLECRGPLCAVVDGSTVREGTMRARFSDGVLADLGGHIPVNEGDGTFVGIARYRDDGMDRLREATLQLAADPGLRQSYYTEALRRLIDDGMRVECVDIGGTRWLEVDTPEDLRNARTETFFTTAGAV